MLGVFLTKFIDTKILDIQGTAIYSSVAKEIASSALNIVFFLYFLFAKIISNELLIYEAFMIYIQYICLLFNETIKTFFSKPSVPISRHKNMATIEIILWYILLKYVVFFFNSIIMNDQNMKNVYIVLLYFSILNILQMTRTILEHIFYLLQTNKHISVYDHFIIQHWADFIFIGTKAIISTILYLYIITAMPGNSITTGILIQAIQWFKESVRKRNTITFVKTTIHQFDTPTQEEVDVDNTCIICRTPMTVEDSKKLPCGHIFHKDCIIQWFSTNNQCPTCRRTIPTAMPNPNNHRDDEEN